MITLHDRERAFEAKFAHDDETRFRLLARRDKLFAFLAVPTMTGTCSASPAPASPITAGTCSTPLPPLP